MSKRVVRDERTEYVENKSYKIAFITLIYLLFFEVFIRGLAEVFAWNIPWYRGFDILGLVIIANGIAVYIQYKNKLIDPVVMKTMVVMVVLGICFPLILFLFK